MPSLSVGGISQEGIVATFLLRTNIGVVLVLFLGPLAAPLIRYLALLSGMQGIVLLCGAAEAVGEALEGRLGD